MKIEIGSGEYPRLDKSYIHCDVRYLLPHQEVCFNVLAFPFRDSSVEEILAVHILEHISHREVHLVLAECFRVLRPNGLLRLYVPNLEQLARFLLDKEREIDVIVGWIYGGQKYPEDAHRSGFTPDTLRAKLEECGFDIVLLDPRDGIYVEAKA